MTDLFKLILGILASRLKARATLEAANLVLLQQVNCGFAGERRSGRTNRSLKWCRSSRVSARHAALHVTVSGRVIGRFFKLAGRVFAGDPLQYGPLTRRLPMTGALKTWHRIYAVISRSITYVAATTIRIVFYLFGSIAGVASPRLAYEAVLYSHATLSLAGQIPLVT